MDNPRTGREYFGTHPLEEDGKHDGYKNSISKDSNVWLRPTRNFIIEVSGEFQGMDNCRHSQQQYADYAQRKLFLRDSWGAQLCEDKASWKTACISGFVVKTWSKHETWKTPPTNPAPSDLKNGEPNEQSRVGNSTQSSAGRSKSSDPGHRSNQYKIRRNAGPQHQAARSRSFDTNTRRAPTSMAPPPPHAVEEVEPNHSVKEFALDAVYGISLQAFEPETRPEVTVRTHAFCKRMTSPYLFIEINKLDDENKLVLEKVAMATSIALYNRHRQRLAWKHKAPSSAVDSTQLAADLKIFGITGSGQIYKIWCTEPKAGDSPWRGCTMTQVARYDCSFSHDVAKFSEWLNEIHRWAITVHGQSCKNELEVRVGQHPESNKGQLGHES